ncbi:hypothetical protein HMPREF1032_00966 [Subdoligranulum sp. 4_3_54A2FAA]|nr:hypothetical protein HMPREF1032_00966 [Subdoligranulum sp. 4_3_54A2FAA]
MHTARAARAVQLSGACGRANKERGYPSVENFWNDLNKLLSDFYKVTVYKGRWVQYLEGLGMTIALAALACLIGVCIGVLNSVYTRSGQNSTPNSNATNLHSSQKRCCSFCISSSNASPTFQVQKSIFHQMTKPIQVTVILPLLLAISFSRNDDIHSSISGISNDLIGVIPTIGQ